MKKVKRVTFSTKKNGDKKAHKALRKLKKDKHNLWQSIS